ncbi:MAG: alpha/beta fold hydrolase [Rhodospirillales bacterium]|nr:alpha/beta fold hydrolase [Rhodospirillales bacterium]
MAEKIPLLLVPGLLNDEALWRHQVDTLVDVAAISVPDVTKETNIASMARRLLKEAPAKFALAGLSMGGYLAFEIMRQAPSRVIRLALLDTTARADFPTRTEERRRLIALVENGKFDQVCEQILPTAVHPEQLKDEAVASSFRDQARRVGPDAFIRQQRTIMSRVDSRKDLPAIRCPTLVLCGRQDVATPLEVHQEIAAGIPRAAMVMIEDCGHLPPMERPRATSAVLRYWLAQG